MENLIEKVHFLGTEYISDYSEGSEKKKRFQICWEVDNINKAVRSMIEIIYWAGVVSYFICYWNVWMRSM